MSAPRSSPRGLARLDLGQRMYVVRDENGAAVGAWGTVARLRYSDRHHAWIRLDMRHERCSFPADDASRSTWLLTYAAYCTSVEPAPAPRCRRCVECVGQPHHWLTSVPEFPEVGEPYVPCKHCDARAAVCEECWEGPVWPPTTNNQRCELCNAQGGA